ncbi:hypothetical protein LAZ67_8002549 [Cordylochernes scorpioides]|uniref:Uncharacterized protein n=1 Tax=Cordylochernes scorpioides TaxID=51811 RepID=A0ABY6KRI3_9ARAC|nr:hypothetical protein LAZ67_8002549 [Cordylochernes scorpioides]
METSEALHWTQQQQKIDPEQQLYTPKNITTATSEALLWTQQQQKIDPEQQLYTPKYIVTAVIEITAALHTQEHYDCCDRDVRRHLRLFIGHNNNRKLTQNSSFTHPRTLRLL